MNEFKLRFVSWIGWFLVTIIGKSLRIRLEGEIPKGPVIYAFWHSDFFPLVYANRNRGIVGLVSPHQDGEYLARMLKPLGYKVVRSTSGDKGIKGVRKILKLKKNDFAIAPDGPIGPAYQVKNGVLKLAELTDLPIIPIGIGISRLIRFNSWDRFKLPLLFSKCVIYWGAPIWVKKSTEELRERLESDLINVNMLADSLL